MELCDRTCVPCRGGVPPLSAAEAEVLLKQLAGAWQIIDDHHLASEYSFPDFAQALRFVNTLGAIAEEQGHHPDLHLAWGKVRVEIWTHKIDGLTESDFVLAAKFERAASER